MPKAKSTDLLILEQAELLLDVAERYSDLMQKTDDTDYEWITDVVIPGAEALIEKYKKLVNG